MTTQIFDRFTKCSSIILKILNGTISWCTISRQYQLLYRQDSLKSKRYLLKPAGATNQLEDNYKAGNIQKLKKKLCIHGFLDQSIDISNVTSPMKLEHIIGKGNQRGSL